MILENVDNLVSKKFIHTFREWERELASYGYWNYWKCLNAKHYGVPQNRNRVFLVSFLKEQRFDFPKPIKLERRLKDVLETTVSERYYLPDDAVAQMLDNASGSALLTAPKGRVSVVGKLSSSQNSRVIDTEGISPALINGNKDGMPKILVECQDEFLNGGGYNDSSTECNSGWSLPDNQSSVRKELAEQLYEDGRLRSNSSH